MIEGLFEQSNYILAKKLIDVSVLRHEALAANLANVESPGYKRLQVDGTFEQKLRTLVERGEFRAVKELEPTLREDLSVSSLRTDGNNVELDKELIALNRNSIEHEVLAQFLSGSLNYLRHAITGRTG